MELHGECESEFSGDERTGVGRDRVEVMNLAGEVDRNLASRGT